MYRRALVHAPASAPACTCLFHTAWRCLCAVHCTSRMSRPAHMPAHRPAHSDMILERALHLALFGCALLLGGGEEAQLLGARQVAAPERRRGRRNRQQHDLRGAGQYAGSCDKTSRGHMYRGREQVHADGRRVRRPACDAHRGMSPLPGPDRGPHLHLGRKVKRRHDEHLVGAAHELLARQQAQRPAQRRAAVGMRRIDELAIAVCMGARRVARGAGAIACFCAHGWWSCA